VPEGKDTKPFRTIKVVTDHTLHMILGPCVLLMAGGWLGVRNFLGEKFLLGLAIEGIEAYHGVERVQAFFWMISGMILTLPSVSECLPDTLQQQMLLRQSNW
jgi:hypothetical protein